MQDCKEWPASYYYQLKLAALKHLTRKKYIHNSELTRGRAVDFHPVSAGSYPQLGPSEFEKAAHISSWVSWLLNGYVAMGT